MKTIAFHAGIGRTGRTTLVYHLAWMFAQTGRRVLVVEARKPMFMLKPADGAIGGYQQAVTESWHDFRALAERIAARAGLAPPA